MIDYISKYIEKYGRTLFIHYKDDPSVSWLNDPERSAGYILCEGSASEAVTKVVGDYIDTVPRNHWWVFKDKNSFKDFLEFLKSEGFSIEYIPSDPFEELYTYYFDSTKENKIAVYEFIAKKDDQIYFA